MITNNKYITKTQGHPGPLDKDNDAYYLYVTNNSYIRHLYSTAFDSIYFDRLINVNYFGMSIQKKIKVVKTNSQFANREF